MAFTGKEQRDKERSIGSDAGIMVERNTYFRRIAAVMLVGGAAIFGGTVLGAVAHRNNAVFLVAVLFVVIGLVLVAATLVLMGIHLGRNTKSN